MRILLVCGHYRATERQIVDKKEEMLKILNDSS